MTDSVVKGQGKRSCKYYTTKTNLRMGEMRLKRFTKDLMGQLIYAILPNCSFHNAIFVIAHMRSGTTALSNVLCSHSEINGFGESHITYSKNSRLGNLVLSQIRHLSWKPSNKYLFDKILHNRHDELQCGNFRHAKFIFIARAPVHTILSIRNLFDSESVREFGTDDEAANYYAERLKRQIRLWRYIAPENRIGLTHKQLLSNPEWQLERLSRFLHLKQPIQNKYNNPSMNRRGVGDPLQASKYSEIVQGNSATSVKHKRKLEIDNRRLSQLEALYEEYANQIAS